MTMNSTLRTSYASCRSIARQSASNFYYSFYLLPKDRRQAMCVLYAFLRKTDDLGDSEQPVEIRRRALQNWRASLSDALEGPCADPILPAVVDMATRYRMPVECLFQVIEGVEMDLDPQRYATFEELRQYCHLVASAVGMACIHIWGFRSPHAFAPAQECGLAFQLTNILRDLKEDADRGRVYLPQEDLERFGYSERDLAAGIYDQRLQRLLDFQIDRAEHFYRHAVKLEPYLDPWGRRVFGTMITTYHQLLDKIRSRKQDVLKKRLRVNRWHRFRIAATWMLSRPRLLVLLFLALL